MKVRKITFVIAAVFVLASLFLQGCSKKEEELPSIFSDFNFGNRQADIFFKAEAVKKYGLTGKLALTVIHNGIPQIGLLEPEKQSLKIITSGNFPSRAPSFSPDGSKIYYTKIVDGKGIIKEIDLKTGKDTTLLAGNDSYFDPIYFKDSSLIVNVFPEKGNFYLAAYDLKNKKLSRLELLHEGVNLAERAAEPAYDRKNDILYFVNDLSFGGKPKPINIWAYDFKNGTARKITDNSELKTFSFQGQTILSPQYYDLSISNYGKLIYCIRFLDEGQDNQPVSKKNEVHIYDLKTGTDRKVAVEATQIRQPLQISENYLLLIIPEFKEIVLVDQNKPHEKPIFLSLIEVLGDADYFKP